MEELVAVKVIIYGRVQGVFFRAYTEERAVELGLTGYVRNRPDRTVEVYAEGGRKKLDKLIDFVKVGSPASRVDKVETEWSEHTGKFQSFITTY